MKTSRLGRTVCAGFIAFGLPGSAQAVVVDSFFGMNFVGAGGPAAGFQNELDLLSITYRGGGGASYTAGMPPISKLSLHL